MLPVATVAPADWDEKPDLVVAEVVPPVGETGPLRHRLTSVGSVAEWLFGAVCLLLGLALLTSVPLGQFLVLGYLLEVSARVARRGRLRDGFVGVWTAARFGGAALACGVMWLPLYGMSFMAESARIIDPGGRVARQWETGLTILTILCVLHATAACLRGGRVRDFLRPFNIIWLLAGLVRGRAIRDARDGVWGAVSTLRLPYYFWLGARGYLGAFLWLVVPLALLGQGHRYPAVGVLGGVLLGIAVLYVPFVQTRFAAGNRLRAFRELGPIRTAYRRAPLAFATALSFHLLCALPLYVLKIEMIPRDLVFLEGLVFLTFMFPARLAVGWAYSRSARRAAPRHWALRWAGRVVVLPAVAVYVLVVFSSQHLGWAGISSLYEQHAFLLPVPFTKLGQ